MSRNILIKDFSDNILTDFLNLYCITENNYYVIDKLIYKKYEYNDIIVDFFNTIKEYYKPSKKYYLERDITYNNLLTILRQLCKSKNITYFSKIKYDKNKYNIVYYIEKI
jgi:hypothetical protein